MGRWPYESSKAATALAHALHEPTLRTALKQLAGVGAARGANPHGTPHPLVLRPPLVLMRRPSAAAALSVPLPPSSTT